MAVCLQFLSPETVVSSAFRSFWPVPRQDSSNGKDTDCVSIISLFRIGSASATKLLGNVNQMESQYRKCMECIPPERKDNGNTPQPRTDDR